MSPALVPTFPNLDAAEAVISETRAIIGTPIKFTTSSRTGLFGGVKARIANFKSSKAAPTHPCRLCGGAKSAPASPCNVCGGTALAQGARQRPSAPKPALHGLAKARAAFAKQIQK